MVKPSGFSSASSLARTRATSFHKSVCSASDKSNRLATCRRGTSTPPPGPIAGGEPPVERYTLFQLVPNAWATSCQDSRLAHVARNHIYIVVRRCLPSAHGTCSTLTPQRGQSTRRGE